MKKRSHVKITIFFVFIFLFTLTLSACGSGNSNAETKGTIKIGYQKNGTTLLLKEKKELEKELNQDGYQVAWSEFSTASSILEALNAGSIDFANAGDAPSIMALSKGMDFKYIASEPSAPNTEGILVRGDSAIQSIKDLKGKKVAYNQASIAQYLLNQTLSSAGLTIDDVNSVILNPPDASIAFEKGDVDAWVVWDPYLTVSEAKGNKIISTAEGIVPFRSFYFSTSRIAEENPEVVQKVVDHLNKAGKGINENPQEAAKVLETNTKIPAETWINVLKRKDSNAVIIDQQAIDDLTQQVKELKRIQLIKKSIKIEDYIWQP
ncbi:MULTISPECIES: aliphatic sulfonate ABC transporter substrate-binding protein [Bacillus]|uniref:Sulfonate transport system substrate-binding protein n=2 Tax=Bacillus TaxID=1386 RepID=A0ABS4D2R2_9BACI|nr:MULTISPECIES: aliphatic sulfonate ABC transporter substrate-binding protein [Bacillus]ALC80259.1 sulfonate ABC transporter substrate-binding protein [Bacillus gobiensis]MBP1083914.1 sulfonate transport system substrate-binding protein [Bacillus capparidis]MED1098392.1 aliphatic sulfonate ABC transporter substrate-binding protein [Bacillus capparidis]